MVVVVVVAGVQTVRDSDIAIRDTYPVKPMSVAKSVRVVAFGPKSRSRPIVLSPVHPIEVLHCI